MAVLLLEDNRLKALERKPGELDFADGEAQALSSRLSLSTAEGPTAAPKGFALSRERLVPPLAGGAGLAGSPVLESLEPEENFELILDIHEFRRPGELIGAGFCSLGIFISFSCCGGDVAGFSEPAR